MVPRYKVMEALKSMPVLKTEMSFPKVVKLSEKRFLEKCVNSNDKSFPVLWGIYYGRKVGHRQGDLQ